MEERKILIVDDEPDIREILELLLKSNGYKVFSAADGERALELATEKDDLDLIILDIMMPVEDGISVLKKVREFSKVPVLFLTAKIQESDKLDAYQNGGDDYLTKPFSQNELLMKVKSLIRRYRDYSSHNTNSNTGIISVDSTGRKAYKSGELLNLTDTELDMLEFFMQNKGKPVDTKTLYEAIWGGEYVSSAANTIMVHILNLRKKIEDDHTNPMLLKTIWGKGYQFD